MHSDYPKLIEIFSGTSWEAGLVKSLLENAEINTYLKDETTQRSNLFLSTLNSGVKILISSDDYQKAKEVLEEYYKNEGNS